MPFLPFFFNHYDRSWVAQSFVLEDQNWGSGDFPFVVTKIVSNQLNVHKSMGPDGIHPKVLGKLDDIIAGPLSTIYQRSWESAEVPAGLEA